MGGFSVVSTRRDQSCHSESARIGTEIAAQAPDASSTPTQRVLSFSIQVDSL